MRPARSYTCPTCGAPSDEGSRQCDFCRSPIATVRCAHCYHMNIPDNLHCAGCGHPLGLEPLAQEDVLSCPDCSVTLDVFAGDTGSLRDCRRCGGQFVEASLLKKLLERRAIIGEAVPRRVRPQNPLTQKVRYIPCPVCQNLMNRKNFGHTSGIIVDVCHAHGMWFDRGELPLVLAFVESGGMARARQSLLEEQKRRPAELRLRSGARGTIRTGDGFNATDLASATLGLFEFVVDLVRRS